MKVGSKIFGVATVLVAGTTAVALYSLERIAQLNREVVTIASYHAPLSRILSDVEVHARNRELSFYAPGRSVSGAQTATDVVVPTEVISAAMQRARELIQDGQQRALSEADRMKFAALEPLLMAVAFEFRELDAQLSRADRQNGLDPVAMALIGKEVDDLNRVLMEANSRLQQMTEESALAAVSHENAAQRFNLGLTLLSGVVAVLMAFFLSRSLVRPLIRLVRATVEVRQGSRDFDPLVQSRDEIQDLSLAFRDMLHDLRAKERIRERLGKYIDPRIVDQVIEHTDRAGSGGERQVMTVMFADMQGFTSISESLQPTTLVRLLNRYLELMSEPVSNNLGVIDKYIGDAVMAFWGPPFCERQSQAARACAAALEQMTALERFRPELSEILGFRRDLPEVSARVGLATGEVVVGNIGSSVAQGYTVVGDTVNLASRLESINKAYGTRILICERTWAAAREEFEGREVDKISVAGSDTAVCCYELLGRKGQIASEVLKMRDCFEQGLAAYRALQFADALEAFERGLEANPGDVCCRVFIARTRHLEAAPPPVGWDGVWRHNAK
jgi:adenylate cyclase